MYAYTYTDLHAFDKLFQKFQMTIPNIRDTHDDVN